MSSIEWSHIDENKCPCNGSGWAELDNTIWSKCFVHFKGQLHPETKQLLLDEPLKMLNEERKSEINFQLSELRKECSELHLQIQKKSQRISELQFELINRTPTVRAIPAVKNIK